MNPRLSGELVGLRDRFRGALLDDVIPFWFPGCLDHEFGGYFNALDRDGSVLDTDKAVWAQGRMAWMLLTLYDRLEPRSEWLEWGTRGLEFIDQHCHDEDGRLFFQVTREGQPLRKRRYAFSEAFAAIAYAAHYRVTQESASADRARLLFQGFTRWHFTPGLMPPKYTDVRPTVSLGPYMIGLVTAQELRRCLGEDLITESWTDRCVNEIQSLFVKPEEEVVMEQVGPGGEIIDHFDGRLLNPGHAIEAGWFFLEEGRWRGDKELMQLGGRMVDWMWAKGWDREYGGLLSFCDLRGKPVQEYWHDMKFWWPHNEAMIAHLMAYSYLGDESAGHRFQELVDWSFDRFSDSEFGEWFGYLRRDGSVSMTLKGNLWKSCFHLPRSLLRCLELLDGIAPESNSGSPEV